MAFDSSEYRQNTYGAPDYYCDVTRSLASSGTGTLGDPWNLNQAAANAVAGDVVGMMRVGSGTPVDMAATSDEAIPAFNPTNSGTAVSPIVYTCQYAAVALDYDTITTNQDRTEFRHDGTASAADVNGTGCPMLGSNGSDHIIYDGFFINMAEANITEDSGVLRVDGTTGMQFRNFVIKGTTTDVDSNCIIYRSQGAIDTVLSNFRARDFVNAPTGGGLNQPCAFSDAYGDENFIIEHFEILNCGKGIFTKSEHPTTPPTTHRNYGVIRYGIVANGISGLRFASTHPSFTIDVHHVLVYGNSDSGVTFANGNPGDRQNIHLDHLTIVGGAAGPNQYGGIYVAPETGTNNRVENCIVAEYSAGGESRLVTSFETGLSTEFFFDYNGYARNAASPLYQMDPTNYTSLASWQTAISGDTNSVYYDVTTTDIFQNRGAGDYHVTGGHAALTASDTGGEIGCYEGEHVIGVDLTASQTSTVVMFI